MQKYEGLHKMRISLQLKNKWTNVNIFLNNILHQLTITRGWMCPQNKKNLLNWCPLSALLSAPDPLNIKENWKCYYFHFIKRHNTALLDHDEWMATWENMKASLQTWMYFQCIFLLSAMSKNLVVAALKGKTSMVLSPQNWQLDTPEGKDWYINV